MDEPLGHSPELAPELPPAQTRVVWTLSVSPGIRRFSAWHRWGRHVVLLVLTGLSIYSTQRFWYDEPPHRCLELAGAVLAVLLAHEMGHYLACRYYRIDATPPFFIPAPIVNPLVGTFGAVIRIGGRFPTRKTLFDVGIAGPLAGFAVCLPILAVGILEARVVPTAVVGPGAISLGFPLLYLWAVGWLRNVPAGFTVLIGPFGTAAWFGLFLTGLNLIPIGQLDGGHLTYALFRHRALLISRAAWMACLVLVVLVGPSWIVWAVLVRVIGFRHPPTLDDTVPLGRARLGLALIAVAVFALCFIPNPLVQSWGQAHQALRELIGR